MTYTAMLTFDQESEALIRDLWKRIEEQGITSALPATGIPPHISLGGFEQIDQKPFLEALEVFAERTNPVWLLLGAAGTFPGEHSIVFLAPIVTMEILHLHADFHRVIAGSSTLSRQYYQPGWWIPHCTVAIDVPQEEIAAAVAICRNSPVFRPIRLVDIVLAETSPKDEIARFPLGVPAKDEKKG